MKINSSKEKLRLMSPNRTKHEKCLASPPGELVGGTRPPIPIPGLGRAVECDPGGSSPQFRLHMKYDLQINVMRLYWDNPDEMDGIMEQIYALVKDWA